MKYSTTIHIDSSKCIGPRINKTNGLNHISVLGTIGTVAFELLVLTKQNKKTKEAFEWIECCVSMMFGECSLY